MFRKILLFLVIALIAVPAFAKPVLKVGSPPPPFSLKNLSGKTIKLKSYLGSKPIILSFFASWSKSCKKEISFLQDLSSKHKNLKVIGVSFDRKSNDLKNYVSANKISFEILHDSKLKTLRDYRILIIPTLFVIDKSGKVKSIYVDFDKNVEKAVATEIKKLLVP